VGRRDFERGGLLHDPTLVPRVYRNNISENGGAIAFIPGVVVDGRDLAPRIFRYTSPREYPRDPGRFRYIYIYIFIYFFRRRNKPRARNTQWAHPTQPGSGGEGGWTGTTPLRNGSIFGALTKGTRNSIIRVYSPRNWFTANSIIIIRLPITAVFARTPNVIFVFFFSNIGETTYTVLGHSVRVTGRFREPFMYFVRISIDSSSPSPARQPSCVLYTRRRRRRQQQQRPSL